VVDDVDLALLALLRRDARIPVVELAAALRCSPSAASRRLDRLLERGALAFDVEIAPEHLGFGVEALLWLDVAPGALDETGRAVAGHAPVALAAATSGSSNLLLAVGCRDTADLYDYLARRLGPLPAVAAIHSAPVIRTVKRAGTVLDPPPA
jgi:DNA-binding Lrp family transcriptional regulator